MTLQQIISELLRLLGDLQNQCGDKVAMNHAKGLYKRLIELLMQLQQDERKEGIIKA